MLPPVFIFKLFMSKFLRRLQKGTLKFFQSKTTLQRQTSKLYTRRETLDKRAAHMRNEYMLTIAAANVHQQRYYSTDLPYVIDVSLSFHIQPVWIKKNHITYLFTPKCKIPIISMKYKISITYLFTGFNSCCYIANRLH